MKFNFHYTGIRARDLDKTVRFFVEGLGMTQMARDTIPETGGIVVELKTNRTGHMLEINWYPDDSPFATEYVPGEALDHLSFQFSGGRLEDAIRHLEKYGGKLRIAPTAQSGGRIAYVDSPDGHTIELYERGA